MQNDPTLDEIPNNHDSGKSKKSLILVIVSVVIIIIVLSVVAFFYFQGDSNNTADIEPVGQIENTKPTSIDDTVAPPVTNIEGSQAIDKNLDSDGDGLSDFLEITRYKTHPNNPDTDGDGYTDGEEVSAGYDPLVGASSYSETCKDDDCLFFDDGLLIL